MCSWIGFFFFYRYLPPHYFVSVLPVRHDVIELIDEPLQISHLAGFLPVESEGLGVLPNEARKRHSQNSVCACSVLNEQLVTANDRLDGSRK